MTHPLQVWEELADRAKADRDQAEAREALLRDCERVLARVRAESKAGVRADVWIEVDQVLRKVRAARGATASRES